MTSVRGRIVLFVVTLAAAGCEAPQSARTDPSQSATQQERVAPPPLTGNIHSAKSDDGRYELRYVTTPDPLPLNEMFAIDIVLLDASTGKPPASADLSLLVDARMPEHQHGMNVAPKVENLGNGRFRATRMLFHMPGYWELYFDIAVAGVTTRVQFDMTLD